MGDLDLVLRFIILNVQGFPPLINFLKLTSFSPGSVFLMLKLFPGCRKMLHALASLSRASLHIDNQSFKRRFIKNNFRSIGTEAISRKVQSGFHIVNNIFRHRKVRYRGLAKNGHQLYTLFGLANVVIGARSATA